jgi:uncharacterized membrane protein YfcA
VAKYIIVGVITVMYVFFAYLLFRDLWKNRASIKDEPGSLKLLGPVAPVVMFLATMGVSDIVVNTLFYNKCSLVDDKRLPGSLIVPGALPLGVVAIAYLITSSVDLKVVLTVAICQSLGAALGVRLVAGMQGTVIKKIIGTAMLLTAVFLLLKLVGIGTTGGSMTTFPLGKLIVCGVCALLLGAFNMLGMGIKAPMMSLLLTLGLASSEVLAVILTACSFSAVSGGVQFIRRGLYQRRIALVYSTFGFIGIALGFLFVMNLNPMVLQIILLVITVYTGFDLLIKRPKAKI